MVSAPVGPVSSAPPPMSQVSIPPTMTVVVPQPKGWAPLPHTMTPSSCVSSENVDSMWPALSPNTAVPRKALRPPPTTERPPSSCDKVRVTIHQLPSPRAPPPDRFLSTKVFVGGLHEDVYQGSRSGRLFKLFFEQFGKVHIEFPPRTPVNPIRRRLRYLHVVFDNEEAVRRLLAGCTLDAGGRFFLQCGGSYPPVNVRPFVILDSQYRAEGVTDVDHHFNSVLVTNIPRHYPASKLAVFAERCFGPVASVDIRLDCHFYPMGSAILTFATHVAFVRAVYTKWMEIDDYFRCWEVDIQPYAIFDRECESCHLSSSTHFCRNVACLHYFCEPCFSVEHRRFPHVGEETPDVLIYHREESRPASCDNDTTASAAAEIQDVSDASL